MNKKRGKAPQIILSVVLLSLLATVAFVVIGGSKKVTPPEASELAALASSLPPEPIVPVPMVEEIVIRMVGDNLLHMPVVNSGMGADGTYNFDHFFENIADEISSADIAIINQETVLGGVEIGLSEYPQFNSPQEVGDAIASAGFDVVMHANNHAMDRGYGAMATTLEFWKKYPEVVTVGANASAEERERVRIVERGGIKIAFISHTLSLNGIAMPADAPWLVNMLTEEEVRADARAAYEAADFVIALPHWGNEYQYTASSSQELFAQIYAEEGVDIIIGTHPHVLEPFEWIDGKDGKKVLVYYSLGNFISNQDKSPRMLGGMAEIKLIVTDGVISLDEYALIPLVTHYENGRADTSYTTYRLDEYTEELAAVHGVRGGGNEFSLDYLNRLATEILGEGYNQRFKAADVLGALALAGEEEEESAAA